LLGIVLVLVLEIGETVAQKVWLFLGLESERLREVFCPTQPVEDEDDDENEDDLMLPASNPP
jgi:hypothetical protein